MSALFPVAGIPQPPVSVDFDSTDPTDIIVNDTNQLMTVLAIGINNDHSNNAATFRLQLTNDDTTYHHVWFGDIAAETAVDTIQTPIFIFPGFSLVGTAETADMLLLHANYVMGLSPIGGA